MASRLMRSIAHASSAPNIALVDAMSLIWLLLMLLVMVVLELLSSRGSCVSSRGFEQKEHRKLSSLSIGSAHAF